MIGNWRKLRNGELDGLWYSKNIIQTIKLRRMRKTRHVERVGMKKIVCRVLVRSSEGKLRVW